MRTVNAGVPDLVPILSRASTATPAEGVLHGAGVVPRRRAVERPSALHPPPLLASVARLVNDLTSDAHRSRLAGLIPCVIGMTSDDPRIDTRIALRCARAALPIAAAEDQNVMAVGRARRRAGVG